MVSSSIMPSTYCKSGTRKALLRPVTYPASFAARLYCTSSAAASSVYCCTAAALSVMVRRSEPKRPSCTESVCVSVLFASSSALLCGRSFSGAAPRAFFASFAANICCAAAFTASFAAESAFSAAWNASSSTAVSCSSTRMRFCISVISNVICAASRTASMALNWRRFSSKAARHAASAALWRLSTCISASRSALSVSSFLCAAGACAASFCASLSAVCAAM